MQERYWLEQRFSPDQATHNVPVFFRLRGPLDVFALRGAVEGLLRRHQVLRGRIVETGGQPRVRIGPFEGLRFEEKDLRGAANPGEQIQALLLELLDAPFDLARAPADARRPLPPGRRRVGAGAGFPPERLRSAFRSGAAPRAGHRLRRSGRAAGRQPPPAAGPAIRRFRGLAAARAGRPAGRRGRALAGAPGRPARAALLAGRPPAPASPSRRGAQILGSFGPELRDQLAQRGAELGIEKELLVLAALAALLARVGSHGFVTIGLPVALRPPELEPLIGNFDNLVVLTARLGGDPSFRAVAAQVASEEAKVRGAGFFPYEQLVEALRPERTPESDPFSGSSSSGCRPATAISRCTASRSAGSRRRCGAAATTSR